MNNQGISKRTIATIDVALAAVLGAGITALLIARSWVFFAVVGLILAGCACKYLGVFADEKEAGFDPTFDELDEL